MIKTPEHMPPDAVPEPYVPSPVEGRLWTR